MDSWSPDPVLDPRLLLLDAHCEVVAEADDHVTPYDTNARLDYVVPATGVFTIVSTTAGAGDDGDYLLGLWADAPPVGENCLDDGWTWEYGDSFGSAALNGNDWISGPGGDDRYHDDFEFEGQAGDGVEVAFQTSGIVGQVLLLGPACEVLATAAADPSAADLDLTLDHTLAAAGVHTVVVSSVEEIGDTGATGSYTLGLDRL